MGSSSAAEPTYTFRFGIKGRTVAEDHVTKKTVLYSSLLERFDQAYDWVMANPVKRYAEVYGPGMKARVVTPTTREYILDRLPDNMPKKKSVIGLAWMDLTEDDLIRDYRLYKFWVSDVLLPDVPERPLEEYGLTEVAVEDVDLALEWARANRWHDHGIWVNGKPALVFTPDYQAVEAACPRCLEMLPYLPQNKLHRAPVRYDWTQRELPYPRMAPTRATPQIQKLRLRFPTASDDMKVAPLEYLIWKHGYGLAR